jgi:hypothetical protein
VLCCSDLGVVRLFVNLVREFVKSKAASMEAGKRELAALSLRVQRMTAALPSAKCVTVHGIFDEDITLQGADFRCVCVCVYMYVCVCGCKCARSFNLMSPHTHTDLQILYR